jgi:hypothetical protein
MGEASHAALFRGAKGNAHGAEKKKATEQKKKKAKLFQFTATSNNPWDEVQFTFWKHKVTNIVLSAIRLALKEDTVNVMS